MAKSVRALLRRTDFRVIFRTTVLEDSALYEIESELVDITGTLAIAGCLKV